MHIRYPWFTYRASELFTKIKEKTQKFEEIGESQYIYQTELDKTCFQYDIIYGDFKDLTKRTVFD